MKKVMILLIMVAMVFGFSFSVLATMPALVVDGTPAEIEVRARFAPYAVVEVISDDSFFVSDPQGVGNFTETWLTGEPGIYANDGARFEEMLDHAFSTRNYPNLVHSGQSGSDTDANVGIFEVTTNTPIYINLSWDPTGWIPGFEDAPYAETLLGIWDRSEEYAAHDAGQAFTGDNDFEHNNAIVQVMFPGKNIGKYVAAFGNVEDLQGLGMEASMLQNYSKCLTREYSLVAGFYLEKNTQVRGGQTFTSIVNIDIEDAGVVI